MDSERCLGDDGTLKIGDGGRVRDVRGWNESW